VGIILILIQPLSEFVDAESKNDLCFELKSIFGEKRAVFMNQKWIFFPFLGVEN
jgi:hypothetical protein